MAAKKLDSLLNPARSGGLGDVVRRARGMGELVSRLREALPADEGSSIVAANIRDDGTLVVLVTSPAWASRLRFETESLITAAGHSEPPVTACLVKVARGGSDR